MEVNTRLNVIHDPQNHPIVEQSGTTLEGFEDWGDFEEEEELNGIDPDSYEYYFDLIK